MSEDIDFIRVENYHRPKKKKSRKKVKTIRAVIAILLILLMASIVAFFLILGRRDKIAVTEGAVSAYVPAAGENGSDENTQTAGLELTPAMPVTPTPVPTPAPTPEPTPAPVNNNPATGTVLLRKFEDQACTISVTNNLSTDCCLTATHVKSDTDAVIVFVRAGESCEFMVPSGTFSFFARTGEVFHNTETYFGPDTVLLELASSVSCPWSETVNISVNG